MLIDYSKYPHSVLVNRVTAAISALAAAPKSATAVAAVVAFLEPMQNLGDRLNGAREAQRLAGKRGGEAGGGRPKVGFYVEDERCDPTVVWGAKAAAAYVGTTTAMINTRCCAGRWFTKSAIDQNSGAEYVTAVRRATPEEEAAALAELSGT